MNQITENQSVNLRALEPEDIDILYQWENDCSIWQVSNTLTPFSKFQLKEHIENSKKDIYETKELRLMIERISDNKPLGIIDLYDFDPYHLRAGIGISINAKEERGKHYASEALAVFCDYVFFHLGLTQLFCEISEDNEVSLNLFKSQGFKITGKKEAWLKAADGYSDVFFLQKLKSVSR